MRLSLRKTREQLLERDRILDLAVQTLINDIDLMSRPLARALKLQMRINYVLSPNKKRQYIASFIIESAPKILKPTAPKIIEHEPVKKKKKKKLK